MYFGKIVELAPARTLFKGPKHPYTWALMASAAPPGRLRNSLKKLFTMTGEPPSPLNPPQGCALASRCSFVSQICHQEDPVLKTLDKEQSVACHHFEKISALGSEAVYDHEHQNLKPLSFNSELTDLPLQVANAYF
jgi:oligopeptide/dipeptide ABC transporter ATP-binding protein